MEATILIADDEPAVRDALAGLLAAEGCRILFAGDGQQALSKAAEAGPDLGPRD
jgi:two-component system response regulator MprA